MKNTEAINLNDKLSKFNKQWHPHRIATVDDNQVYLAKVSGDSVWHKHDHEDELFQIPSCYSMNMSRNTPYSGQMKSKLLLSKSMFKNNEN